MESNRQDVFHAECLYLSPFLPCTIVSAPIALSLENDICQDWSCSSIPQRYRLTLISSEFKSAAFYPQALKSYPTRSKSSSRRMSSTLERV